MRSGAPAADCRSRLHSPPDRQPTAMDPEVGRGVDTREREEKRERKVESPARSLRGAAANGGPSDLDWWSRRKGELPVVESGSGCQQGRSSWDRPRCDWKHQARSTTPYGVPRPERVEFPGPWMHLQLPRRCPCRMVVIASKFPLQLAEPQIPVTTPPPSSTEKKEKQLPVTPIRPAEHTSASDAGLAS